MSNENKPTKKTVKEKLKVVLAPGYYFYVNDDSFDLFHQDPNKKTPTLLGYFSRLDRAIHKVVQHRMSRFSGEASLEAFLDKWSLLQEKLIGTLKKYGYDLE